jgi:hypothetical protein
VRRPFFTTPKGQRLALHLSNLLSILLLAALALQVNLVEAPRKQVPQLQSDSLQSCIVLECGKIEDLAGLEPISVIFTEGKYINTVRVEFVNHGRLEGERDFRLELRDAEAGFLEAASSKMVLNLNGRNHIDFGLTHPKSVIDAGSLILRY